MTLGDYLEQALHARRRVREVKLDEHQAVVRYMDEARIAGASWTQIGKALGITEVGARRYYNRNKGRGA